MLRNLATSLPPALALLSAPAAARSRDWREPPRTYPDGVRWACIAVR